MKLPMNGVAAPSRASFVPEMSTTQYRTKNRMDTTAGVPSPPVRMREPMGAPMKKRMKQASAWAYLFQISTSLRRRRRVYSYASIPWVWTVDWIWYALVTALSYMRRRTSRSSQVLGLLSRS